MTKKMTVAEFKTWAKSRGWVEDKWGNMQKTIGDHEYRFKISSTSVRDEVKVRHPAGKYSSAKSEWVRISSGYFKDLHFTAEDKLGGMRR